MKVLLTYLGLVTTLAFAAAGSSGSATAGSATTADGCSIESCSPSPDRCGPGPCGPCGHVCEVATVAAAQ
jgi:hypothetical protein